MKRFRFLFAALFAATLTLGFTSCSKDDNEPDSSSPEDSFALGLTINGKKSGTIHDASCVVYSWYEDEDKVNGTSFEMKFDYDDYIYAFDVAWNIDRSEITYGMNLMDYNTPEFMVFRSMNSLEVDVNYSDFSGDVYVEALSSNTITLKFSNFSFYKSLGRQTYTINGIITYTIN